LAGVEVKAWCAPAANNRNEPNRLMWPAGGDLPAALNLVLPFQDLRQPVSTNAALGSSHGVRQALIVAAAAAVALAAALACQ
jgi:hypothetical protein